MSDGRRGDGRLLGSGFDSLARISWREISRTSSSVSHGAVTAPPAWNAAPPAAAPAHGCVAGRCALGLWRP